MSAAAITAAVLLSVVTVFQISLAMGAPAGEASWGGGHSGVLPMRFRIASGIAGLLFYPLVLLFVLDAGDLIETGLAGDSAQLFMWLLASLFALGAVANFASKSRWERLWGPVALVISACCGFLAAGL